MATEIQTIDFVWEGKDKRGKKLKGEQTAPNANLIKAELRRQGITPIVVKRKPKSLFGGEIGGRIKPKDIAIFSRQLSTMINSGVPLVTGLEVISGGLKNPKMKKLVNEIRSDVAGGMALFEALKKHPVQFDELYTNLVKAGESAGVLDNILESVATYKENIESIKGKIKKAMYYPAAIIMVAVGVTILLLVKVIPQFQEIFNSFGADLPAFTKMMIGLSETLRANGWWWFLIFIGIVFGLIYAKKRSLRFAHFLDRLMLKIPIVGGILNNAAIARFSRTLAITFAAGVPLADALRIVSGATGNAVYNDAAADIREDVVAGHQLQLAMKQVNIFPNMVVQMTAIGEEAGSLDSMLNKVADVYEEEVNNSVDALSSLLEPLIIVIVGFLVGSIVIAMYLPIFKLAATI